MRIIDVCDSAIETVAVSPDGRYVGASSKDAFGVFHWATGEAVLHASGRCDQIAFAIDSQWVMRVAGSSLLFDVLNTSTPRPPTLRSGFAGGLAMSSDGRMLVASESAGGGLTAAALARWALPGFHEISGFEDWSPLRRLAFSPNGQFLAGLWPGHVAQWRTESAVFELRYAASGGVDYRYRPPDRRAFPSIGFVSFTRDSGTCAFGWQDEFHVLDISTGTYRYLRRVEAEFRDAAFTGSGHLFGTVDEGGRLKLWDVKTWQVMREYDWQCGALTSLAFTADGSAGVCGTTDGRLVQFDVDE